MKYFVKCEWDKNLDWPPWELYKKDRDEFIDINEGWIEVNDDHIQEVVPIPEEFTWEF